MKRFFILLLLISLLESCSNKSIQLPETDNSSITEIKDISPAYLFYDETKEDSIVLNRKNLIITTNWLINVDKRLTLKQAIPSIIFLQNKKRNAKMHKNEAAKNYFTCSNPKIKNLAFIEFTDVIYHDKDSKEIYFLNSKFIKPKFRVFIDFKSSKEIKIRKEDTYWNSNIDSLLSVLNEQVLTKEIEQQINLTFKKSLAFQDYITFKSLLLKLNLPNVSISNDEFIN